MAESIRYIRGLQESIRDYVILNTEELIYEMAMTEDFKLLKNPIIIQSMITGVRSLLETRYRNKTYSDTSEYLRDLEKLLNQHLDHYIEYGFSEKIFSMVTKQIVLCNSITRPLGFFKNF